MYVEHTMVVVRYEERGYHQEESGQNDEIDLILPHERHDSFLIAEHFASDDSRVYTKTCGALKHTGVGAIADHKHNFGVEIPALEVSDYVFGIGAVAGGKYGYFFHWSVRRSQWIKM